MGEALSDLPPPSGPDERPPVANHVDVTPRRDQERIAYVPEGLWLAKVPDVPPDILCKLTRKDTTKFRRLHRDDISPTLRCGEALYHPQENRYITPREAGAVAGLSRQARIRGTHSSAHRPRAELGPTPSSGERGAPPLAHSVVAQLRSALCL